MPTNSAAWMTSKAGPLEVKEAPYTPPKDNEIVIKNGAAAINPVDWFLLAKGTDLFPWVSYPSILGSDLAGEVVEVGSAITRFNVGDRVLGMALAMGKTDSPGSFQAYSHVLENLAAPIPSSLSYESAAVLPLGLSTAACGLFQKHYLGLQHPTVPPKPTGQTVLIWSGASSVGSNGIQLAVAAGYEVITTCSPKNNDYVATLGASQAFDYNSPTVVQDIVAALKGKSMAGAYAIGNVAAANNGVSCVTQCIEIVEKSDGNKFVATAMHIPEGLDTSVVGCKFVFGSDLKDNEVGHAVYGEFLGKALAEGAYRCAPEPLVVGKGLEAVQAAFEVAKKGVSAKKVVVSL